MCRKPAMPISARVPDLFGGLVSRAGLAGAAGPQGKRAQNQRCQRGEDPLGLGHDDAEEARTLTGGGT